MASIKTLKKWICASLVSLNLLTPLHSMAGIEKLIKNVMPSGTMSNASRGAIVKDQLSGHIIGGSIIMKSPPIDDLQLMSAQGPKCDFGTVCAKQLDLRAGAFSFIKKVEFERFLKDLVANVGGYAALMAIKTVCPQCENIMTYLEQIVRNINQFNINGCEAALYLTGGIASKLSKGAELTSQNANFLNKKGSDMADIRAKSKDDGSDPTQGRPELESLLGDNYNLVWVALKKKSTYGVGANFREMLMSISGTVIGKVDQGNRSVAHKKSLVTKELVEELIGIESKGREITLYVCDEQAKCLNPTKQITRLSKKDTIYGKIEEMLKSMIKKIKENKEPLSSDEEALVALSGMPLITRIQMDLATMNEDSSPAVREADFLQALCYDVLTKYLGKMLHQTSEAVAEMEYVQLVDTKAFDAFKNEVSEVLHSLSSGKANAFRRLNAVDAAKQRMMQEISIFEQKFSNIASSNAVGTQRD